MQVPVYVFQDAQSVPKLVNARIHRSEAALGEVKGTSFAYAERREESPKVIFMVAEHEGERGEFVIVSSGEGYRLDNDEPTYNLTKSWYSLALSADQLTLYEGPEEKIYGAIEADLTGFDGGADGVVYAWLEGDLPGGD